MTVQTNPLPAIQPHNERAASVWSSGGRDYEEIIRGVYDGIDTTVAALAPRPGERILDVATGTGITARACARRGAHVTGIDIAAGLLDAARGLSDGLAIDYRLGDAEALPLPDAGFDAVVSTFGVMFVGRPEAAAGELARVCRPGGRLALATWTPDGAIAEMFAVMRPYMAAPPAVSPFDWGRPERLRQLLGDAFDLTIRVETSHYVETGGEAAWNTFVTGYGPTRALAASLDEDRRAALKRDFVAFHERYREGQGIHVPRTFVLTLGMRR
ncbi:methyltransferase domain-containing protein (plasmid) [Skermanella sp. TT6]|uniref:Methyltransferase domain-containing protein n=1 Tax=Skermanella cutis TaxID=2775420 RepID=A0ABX7BH17_9PROT|nr:methyltransferase domain-containing protein [Skermanella sp. TT6]QQP93690.1 methyltransferase domain-containing protein [Skermanella sp. TT6]